MVDALYLPDGDSGFVATEHTGGPWDPALQHGGPVAALLARAIEREPGSWPATVVRIAVELLGPVPVGPVSVATRVVRSGRSVELVEAELCAGGRTAALARGWRIRVADLDLPRGAVGESTAPPMPDRDSALPPFSGGFLQGLQMRAVSGSWLEPGPMMLWARLAHPVVADEQPTALQRLLTLADCGNGVSGVVPLDRWLFINPDLTVHLSRPPAGEWFGIEARSTLDPAGFGLARSRLYDTAGEVGVGAQSLFVSPRSG